MRNKIEEADYKFAEEMMHNYPEAGNGACMRCLGWDYEKPEYDFIDDEENKRYKLTRAKIRKGFDLFIELKDKGELKGIPWTQIDKHEWDHDADTCDAIVQLALLGEVVYG